MDTFKDAIKKVDDKLLFNLAKNYGDEYVKWLVKLLKEAKKIASGRLIRSIDYKLVKAVEGYLITIQHEDYLLYVNDGRAKGKKPPPVSAIEKWIKIRGIVPRQKDMSIRTLAIIIAKGISKNSIQPTNVIQKAAEKVKQANFIRRQKIDATSIIDAIKNDLLTIGSNKSFQINKKK
jgi:hypothetical protein